MTGEQTDARRAQLIAALAAVARGDRAALRTVYDLTSAKLFGICLRISGNRVAAEDILQDVYLKIWHRAGRFDPSRASPITWLCTIARNTAVDWRRSARPERQAPESAAAELADPQLLAPERIAAEQTEGRIHQCLETLDAQPREAIRAAFFDGLSYVELADRMAVPLGTMKSWVRRGLMKLKACLGDD